MRVEFTHKFIKIFKKRIAPKSNIHRRFDERVRKFSDDPNDEQLFDHPLSGKLDGYRAFSVTGDIRVVYYIQNDTAYFIDIGTHNQVYGK